MKHDLQYRVCHILLSSLSRNIWDSSGRICRFCSSHGSPPPYRLVRGSGLTVAHCILLISNSFSLHVHLYSVSDPFPSRLCESFSTYDPFSCHFRVCMFLQMITLLLYSSNLVTLGWPFFRYSHFWLWIRLSARLGSARQQQQQNINHDHISGKES